VRLPSLLAGATTIALLGCASDSGVIRLGMAGPFDEGFGAANRLGAELAVSELNEAGGIRGRQLVMEFRDDRGDGARAAAIAQEFVDDARIAGVIGHVTSGAMVAAAKVYDGHLPAIATTASSAELTGISSWTFRVISSDSANGVDLARFAGRLGKRRVAILYENDSYGRGLAAAFRNEFSGDVIAFDPIEADGRDAEVYAAWLAQQRPDLVFVAGTERSGLALLSESRRLGVSADFLGGDGWTGLAIEPETAEGVFVGAPFTALDTRPEAQRFVASFRARHGTDPDGNAALAYDAVQVMAAGLREVGPNRSRLRDWLARRTEAEGIAGVTGTIAFNPSGDPIGKSVTMTRIRNGTLTLAEDGR
jgi:branched-chain amino acid transport system substrate-binding protein